MAFDLTAALRRLKPAKRIAPIARRSDDALPFADRVAVAGPALLLDTTVYIDVLQGRAPDAVKTLLGVRQIDHSAIAISELTHLFGRLDPGHRDTRAVLATVAATIEDIPPHRLSAPSVQAIGEAGIVAGIIARLRGAAMRERQPLLNDAALFLHALESGATLLSRNIADMDLIGQVVPAGRMLLYRQLD